MMKLKERYLQLIFLSILQGSLREESVKETEENVSTPKITMGISHK